MSAYLEDTMVGDVVGHDFRTAAVFERYGIDFCCGGRRSIADACRAAAVDPAAVEQALQAVTADAAGGSGEPGAPDRNDATGWPVARLIDEIVGVHHQYVRSALPLIGRYLAKLVQVHGARHPELRQVASSFERMGVELSQHMMKEERVLFPYIKELAAGTHLPASPFGTVANPIRMMEREHQDAGDETRLIRELTNGYVVPDDGCTTYRVCLAELAQFERDLHRHVHLENNVLFPKALELERRFVHTAAR
jgi:regulator of cell morphogenesis and NO signaling